MFASSLSVLQRSLVALSALKLGLASRAQLLSLHHVTEADLRRHYADWERLQVMRAAGEPPSGLLSRGS